MSVLCPPAVHIADVAARPRTTRRVGVFAGVALLAVGLLSAFGDLLVVERLVVTDDAARTAAKITDSESLFRLAIVSLLVVAALDIAVAWALFHIFEPVSSGLATVAAWFRVAYAGIFVVAIAQLVGVLRLLPASADATRQVAGRVHSYEDIWSAGLVLFGVHLILLGALVWQAPFAPSPIGILLAVAGLGYAVDALGSVLFAGYGANVAAFTFIGEVLLIFWLLFGGRRTNAALVDGEAAPSFGVRLRLRHALETVRLSPLPARSARAKSGSRAR